MDPKSNDKKSNDKKSNDKKSNDKVEPKSKITLKEPKRQGDPTLSRHKLDDNKSINPYISQISILGKMNNPFNVLQDQ